MIKEQDYLERSTVRCMGQIRSCESGPLSYIGLKSNMLDNIQCTSEVTAQVEDSLGGEKYQSTTFLYFCYEIDVLNFSKSEQIYLLGYNDVQSIHSSQSV
jgi:hypothetical protein